MGEETTRRGDVAEEDIADCDELAWWVGGRGEAEWCLRVAERQGGDRGGGRRLRDGGSARRLDTGLMGSELDRFGGRPQLVW